MTTRDDVRNVKALSHGTAFFGTKKLNEITAWHLEQYKKARKEAGLAPGTINYELSVLKSVLRKAHEWGKLPDLPDSTLHSDR